MEWTYFSSTFYFAQQYRDTFESLIHRNVAINDIQQFHYLRVSLRRNAIQIIQSLEFTPSNCELAWSLLKGKGSTTKQINAYKELTNLNQLTYVYVGYLIDISNCR